MPGRLNVSIVLTHPYAALNAAKPPAVREAQT
jgi:hypothetical protein